MDMWSLKPGDRLRTIDGALAEVVRETEDGQWIVVRYISDTEDAALIGTEDMCHGDELTEAVSAEAGGT